jgi:hypothetical protein
VVLSGTLREFILADVFQLLTQQKITGKLILNSGKNEGFVIFKNGLIIYAEKDNEKLSEKTLNYLKRFSNKPVDSINETISSLSNDIHSLVFELIKRGFLTKEEMSSMAESIIEDICCSLFLWKTGSYRFTSLRTVEEFTLLNLTFPVENIIMEAMRRTDEWYRMQKSVTADTVFVRNSKEFVIDNPTSAPFKEPQNYILSSIDGTSPVSEIVKDSCLSEYKVYETLNNLCLDNTIVPLSEQYTRSVKAALEQKKRERSLSPYSSVISIAAIVCTITLFILTLSLLINKVFLLKPLNEFHKFNAEINNSISQQNVSVANLYYRTVFGKKAEKAEQLSSFKLIAQNDMRNLKSGEILMPESIFKK